MKLKPHLAFAGWGFGHDISMKTSTKILTGLTATALAVGTFHLAQEQTEFDRQAIQRDHASPEPLPTRTLQPESSQKISDVQLLRPVPTASPEKPSKAPTKKPTTKPSPPAPKPVPAKPTPTRSPQKVTPTPSVKPAPKPAPKKTYKPKPATPSTFTIGGYKQCGPNYQACIDAGGITLYNGNILAGHDYMGFAWAYSKTKNGTTIKVSSGAYAGTWKVAAKQWIPRQSGSIPGFVNNYPLVLQTCSGNGTGFALLVRV